MRERHFILVRRTLDEGLPVVPNPSVFLSRAQAVDAWHKLCDKDKLYTRVIEIDVPAIQLVKTVYRYAIVHNDGSCFIPADYYSSGFKALDAYPGAQVVRLDATKKVVMQ